MPEKLPLRNKKIDETLHAERLIPLFCISADTINKFFRTVFCIDFLTIIQSNRGEKLAEGCGSFYEIIFLYFFISYKCEPIFTEYCSNGSKGSIGSIPKET
jgi:hypothetical protein